MPPDTGQQPELFEPPTRRVQLEPGAWWLRGFAEQEAPALLHAVAQVVQAAALRHWVTPGGRRMSVAMTNCGAAGWLSDLSGYRYGPVDPESGRPWPAMPAAFTELAAHAAAEAGYPSFAPDACLINRYVPGAQLSLHQDRDEHVFEAPIVSVSLGLPATFLWGGASRAQRPQRVPLVHGDVVVWGGPARLNFHGIAALRDGLHPLTGAARINLTFRRALSP